MKFNYTAKHAQRSGTGFHTETNKPDPVYADELYVCTACHKFDIFEKDEDLICGDCGSNELTRAD